MGRLFPLIAALVVGASQAIQGPINTELARYVGQFRAVFISVLVSLTTVTIIVLARQHDGSFAPVAAAPRWALLGGLLGVVNLVGTIIAVPRIGVAATSGAVVASQLLASAVLDQLGLLHLAVRPLTPGRLFGLALLIVAVFLVTRG